MHDFIHLELINAQKQINNKNKKLFGSTGIRTADRPQVQHSTAELSGHTVLYVTIRLHIQLIRLLDY